jgi:CheY-like chemotaxis protein
MAKRVLIADDNVIIRNIVKNFLTMEMGVVCEEAADGSEAVERANQSKPDLIILDYAMPKMNGAEAAQALKRSMPEVPIVLYTVFEIPIKIVRDIGFDAVVAKSDGTNKLAECVRMLLTNGPFQFRRGASA